MGNDKSPDFPSVSAKQWKQQIQYELDGADYNETLVWESPEGIRVKPFYSREDLSGYEQVLTSQQGTWKIAEAIQAADAEKANMVARKALQDGSEVLQCAIPSPKIVVSDLLEGIDLQEVSIHFRFDFLSVSYLESLLARLPEIPAGIFLHLDPIGRLVQTGSWFHGQKEDLDAVAALLEKIASLHNVHLLGVDGALYLNAGANTVQQLAYKLAHANEYLNAFDGKLQVSPVFTMAIGADYFFEIAKFRAFRLLWKSLATEYSLPGECHILATPGLRNKTIYDYNNNMLRATSECMSAILGTADTLVNLPYDILYRNHNDFSARMARNQLLIMKYESGLDEITNPSDGAYYLESITRQLAEKSLALFKQLEAGGGFLKQLREHTIQRKIKESADRGQKAFEEGNRLLLGINTQPDREQRMKREIEKSPFPGIAPRKTEIEPLFVRRLAMQTEQNRLADE